MQDDSPHILCLTEHHLQYTEQALSHIENYILGAHYCRNTKHMGGVCMFIQKNIPFTCLEIGNYCKDQDIEICGIQLNHDYDKLCILAVYRSPSGNFDNFLTNLDSVLQKLFLLKFTFIICGDMNIDYLVDNYKKRQLDSILHSFNLSSIVNFPTGIGLSSLSTIDNVFE
jgi:exonuclease III